MLFSRIFDSLNIRKIAIEITAAGIDAETVRPTFRPREALAPARTAERIIPRTTALNVISGRLVDAGINGPDVEVLSLEEVFCIYPVGADVGF